MWLDLGCGHQLLPPWRYEEEKKLSKSEKKKLKNSQEDIARMSHAHPTYAEAVKEAALAATEDRPLHI